MWGLQTPWHETWGSLCQRLLWQFRFVKVLENVPTFQVPFFSLYIRYFRVLVQCLQLRDLMALSTPNQALKD